MPEPLTDKQIRQFANDMLANSWSASRMVEPILKKHGSAAMPVVTLVAKEMELDAYARQSLMQFLERAENRLGAEVVPALRAAADREDAAVAAFAIGRLLKLTPDDHDALVDRVLTGLDGKARNVQRFAEVAGKFDDERVREALWALLVKKTPTVRQAAAEALGEHADDAVVPRATQLLADDAVHTRLGAAAVLGVKRTTGPLFERLRVETDADVRDALVKALGHAGAKMADIAAALPPVDNDTLLADAAKLKPIRFTWLDEKILPPLPNADGPMDPLLVRYMLSRQSKQTSPALDVSIIGLVDQVDRARAGDFAAHLLAALQESARPKQNSWVLILVGLLADNRVLGQLGVALKKWIKNFDAKLGGVALHALRWQGSDAALGMIADVAETYRNETRRKFKLAADTAAACLDAVAAERGVDRETLLDETVPTFGFDDNATRTIVTEKRTVVARIAADFKLAMSDADTGKRVASVPKAAGEAVVAEFKGLRKLLTQAGKQQAGRFERALVDRRVWDGGRFGRLLLGHPLLLPFAQRLIWQSGDTLFRGLDDGSLTDADDEPVDPPGPDASVRLVHPIELDDDTLGRWREHVADYEVEPPFAQLDRPTARVPDDQRDATAETRLDRTELGMLSTRAKLTKAGWIQQGDYEGFYACFVRRFDAANITAALQVDGDVFYPDPSATISLGQLVFHHDAETRKPMKLGDVPPVVYSEAAGLPLSLAGK